MSDTTTIEEIGKLSEAMIGIKEKVGNIGDEFTAKLEAAGETTQELKDNTDKALTELGEMVTRVSELEKLQVQEDVAVEQGFKSLGEKFVESEEFVEKSVDSSFRGAVKMSANRADITTADTTVGTGRSTATSMVPGDRQAGIIAAPDRKLTIRDLLMPGRTSTGSVEYVKETGFTNAAAPVAETAQKPYSDITFDMENAPVRTIAHLFKASRQMMDDAVGLASYIDGRATYGLRFVEENQLLNGDGTGQNINGLMPQSSAYAAAFVPTAEHHVDRMRLAMLQVILAEYPATAFVMHPTDWAKIETTKDAEGRYIVGDPIGGLNKRLWGMPVVDTQAMAVDNWLTGAFNMGAQIFDRMDIEVLLSTENVDDFEKNMISIRAEERLALAVYRPEAFVSGTFS